MSNEKKEMSDGIKWLWFLMAYGVVLIIFTALAFSILTELMDNIVFQGYLFSSQIIIVLIAQKAYMELKEEQK